MGGRKHQWSMRVATGTMSGTMSGNMWSTNGHNMGGSISGNIGGNTSGWQQQDGNMAYPANMWIAKHCGQHSGVVAVNALRCAFAQLGDRN